jgi:hypothetical protein
VGVVVTVDGDLKADVGASCGELYATGLAAGERVVRFGEPQRARPVASEWLDSACPVPGGVVVVDRGGLAGHSVGGHRVQQRVIGRH